MLGAKFCPFCGCRLDKVELKGITKGEQDDFIRKCLKLLDENNWSLKGKGIACGGYPSQTIEFFGEQVIYNGELIQTLHQKLIEDINDPTNNYMFTACDRDVISAKNALIQKIINRRFGVANNE